MPVTDIMNWPVAETEKILRQAAADVREHDKMAPCAKVVAVLLCFIVAFQGSVLAHTLQPPCPMDREGAPSAVVDEPSQARGDCCNDAETAAKTGKLCKTDMPCSAPAACVLPSFSVRLPLTQSADFQLSATAFIASVWRPPPLS